MQHQTMRQPDEDTNLFHKMDLPLWVTLFLSGFFVWEMGILWFTVGSGVVSAYGLLPTAGLAPHLEYAISIGMAAAIAMIAAFPRRCVLFGRTAVVLAIVSSASLLVAGDLTISFYATAFCGGFLIVTIEATLTHLFSVHSVWEDSLVAAVVSGVFICLLHSGVLSLSFALCNFISLLLLGGVLVAFCWMPTRFSPPFVHLERKKGRHRHPPYLLLGGMLILFFAAELVTDAGKVLAKGMENGLFIFYLAQTAGAVLLLINDKSMHVGRFRMIAGYFVVIMLGLLLAYLQTEGIQYISVFLIGFSGTIVMLASFLSCFTFEQYPSRFIAPLVGIMGGALPEMVASGIITAIPDNDSLRNTVFLALAIFLVAGFLVIEPYMARAWDRSIRRHHRLKALKAAASRAAEGGHAHADVESHGGHALPMASPIPIDWEHPLSSLEEEEQRLADLLLSGYSGFQIHRMMGIDKEHYYTVRAEIYRKLGVQNRQELIMRVHRGRPARPAHFQRPETADPQTGEPQ